MCAHAGVCTREVFLIFVPGRPETFPTIARDAFDWNVGEFLPFHVVSVDAGHSFSFDSTSSSAVFHSKATEMKRLFLVPMTINFHHTRTRAAHFLRPLPAFIYRHFYPLTSHRVVETQSSGAAIQPGFQTCPVENSLKAVLCLRNHREKGSCFS